MKFLAVVVHWVLWNFTPPEFAHGATIGLLKAYEAVWLRPVEAIRELCLAILEDENAKG